MREITLYKSQILNVTCNPCTQGVGMANRNQERFRQKPNREDRDGPPTSGCATGVCASGLAPPGRPFHCQGRPWNKGREGELLP